MENLNKVGEVAEEIAEKMDDATLPPELIKRIAAYNEAYDGKPVEELLTGEALEQGAQLMRDIILAKLAAALDSLRKCDE